MSYQATIAKLTQKMTGALEHLQKELASIRGSRASLSLLDHIKVDYYGDANLVETSGEPLNAG